MATYASTTNPFIETKADSPPNGDECGDKRNSSKQARKCTPGMARPRRATTELDVDEARRGDQNLLLDDVVVPEARRNNILDIVEVQDSGRANASPGEAIERLAEADPPPGTARPPYDDARDEEVAVAVDETCLALVERASKLSLSGSPAGNLSSRSEPIGNTHSEGQATTSERHHVTLSSGSFSSDAKSSTESSGPLELGPQKTEGGADNINDDEDDDDVLIELTNSRDKNSAGGDTDRSPADSGVRQHQHIELIKKLRLQLRDLERYAYERGELEQVPTSILAERQSVILDKLRKRLSLNLDRDKIERLELEELKRQVDEEISNLIDPLVTKEHLLNQLKTQLTDLERYISHLHGSIGRTWNDKSGDCSCSLHGCSSSVPSSASSSASSTYSHASSHDPNRSIITNETLPKTSRLIRGLMAQLICSDMKIQEAMKLEGELERKKQNISGKVDAAVGKSLRAKVPKEGIRGGKAPQFHDGAAWTLHIDRVTLATDSLTNLFSLTPKRRPPEQRSANEPAAQREGAQRQQVDGSLVESVVRRQLIPAVRDLLSYGLIDPSSMPSRSSYVSFLIDPYYLLTSFSCLPGIQVRPDNSERQQGLPIDRVHIWDVIVDYYQSKNEVNFRTSSVKTLSQSFSLTPSMDGPIKITSKQALLIAVDDILCQLAKRKPDGPETHFKLFVYTALNQAKLATWLRLVFKNRSILKKYYHDFSFVNQPEKMDRFLATIEALGQFKFTIDTEAEVTDQFVSAF